VNITLAPSPLSTPPHPTPHPGRPEHGGDHPPLRTAPGSRPWQLLKAGAPNVAGRGPAAPLQLQLPLVASGQPAAAGGVASAWCVPQQGRRLVLPAGIRGPSSRGPPPPGLPGPARPRAKPAAGCAAEGRTAHKGQTCLPRHQGVRANHPKRGSPADRDQIQQATSSAAPPSRVRPQHRPRHRTAPRHRHPSIARDAGRAQVNLHRSPPALGPTASHVPKQGSVAGARVRVWEVGVCNFRNYCKCAVAEMAPRTPVPLISVDIRKRPWEQEKPLHNRWHPDIPAVRATCCFAAASSCTLPNRTQLPGAGTAHPSGFRVTHAASCCSRQVAEVKEGDLFRVETVDWTGGQIKDDDSAEDIKHVDLTQVNYTANWAWTPRSAQLQLQRAGLTGPRRVRAQHAAATKARRRTARVLAGHSGRPSSKPPHPLPPHPPLPNPWGAGALPERPHPRERYRGRAGPARGPAVRGALQPGAAARGRVGLHRHL
jgi:hypothetical protein